MLYLITGAPGSGKTLHMISMLAKRKDLKDRPLYLDGIPEVDPQKIPHEPIPEGCSVENWYEWLPPNAILVVDECQRHFRPRPNGSKVPQHVSELETHRHKGVDIFLLTQHPRLVDINVKSFVENHKHISKSQLGTRRIWEWQRCANPDNKGDINTALVRPYRLDKSAFGLYKSAEVHTKIKTGRSNILWFFPLSVIFLLAAGGYTYWYMNNNLMSTEAKEATAATAAAYPADEEGEAQAAPSASAGYYPPPSAASAPATTDIKPEDYVPVFHGKPWTAPIYKPHNQQIATMPFPVACVSSGDKCTCYTEQATPIRDMDKGLCVDFVENGIYNPHKAAGSTQQAAPVDVSNG